MKAYKNLFYFFTLIFFPPFISDIFAKKIIVTGGAGFIGSHVTQRLLQRGDEVVIIDNINDAYASMLKYHNLSCIINGDTDNRLTIYKVDICDSDAMETIVEQEKPDCICHLAARAGVRASIENPYEYVRTNITGTLTIFETARKYNINHIVCASSSSVYGAREHGPFSENDSIEKQLSHYGMTKHAGELLAYTYHYLFGMSITNLRFFTVYGPRGRIDMAPFIFIDAIHSGKAITVFGNGNAIRDFTYIDDIVDGIIKAIDTPLGYEILNLGRGEPIVLTDFIATIENVVGKKAHIEYTESFSGDVPLTHADISKAQSLIEYNPQTSVAAGLSCMYEWYKNEYVPIIGSKMTRSRAYVYLD